MDKEKTGRLIAQARKERGLTQRQLAERLHITAKAVSKWETGVSAPDVGLLIPLAEELGLSATELLEGRRMGGPEDRSPEQVEDIVKSALTYSEQSPELERKRRKKRALVSGACVAVAALETGGLWLLEARTGRGLLAQLLSSFGVMELLSLVFGAYLMLLIPERLPAYYDDNAISAVSFGAFRMNLAGIHFNNRNWPHILRAMRAWCVLEAVLGLPLSAAWAVLFPAAYGRWGWQALLLLFLGGLFVPVYVQGKKYQ